MERYNELMSAAEVLRTTFHSLPISSPAAQLVWSAFDYLRSQANDAMRGEEVAQ